MNYDPAFPNSNVHATRKINVITAAILLQQFQLPTLVENREIVIVNSSGVTIQVIPSPGTQFNSLGIDVPFNIPNSNSYSFAGTAPTVWSIFAAYNQGFQTVGNFILAGDGAGGIENVTIGSGLSFAGGVLSSIGPGTGTVTTVSTSGLTPLFTSSIANPTTTPSISYTLSVAPQNEVFAGPASGGSGIPAYRSLIPSDIPALPYIPASTGTNAQLLANNGSGGLANVNVGAGLLLTGGTLEATTNGGTVTDVSAGALSGLFTTQVINPTTTPVIAFTPVAVGAFTWFGNDTNASATPTFNTSVIPTSIFPALTGDVTNTAGSLATTVGKINGVSLSGLATGIIYNTTGTGVPAIVTIGTGLTFIGGTLASTAAGGTVTSFSAGSLSPIFTTSVATSTTTPDLTFSLSSTSQNFFLAGPTSGSGVPSYRGIVSGDVPTLNQNTTGSAGSFTGSLSGDVTGTQSATTVVAINNTNLAGLASGIIYNTTSTGVPSIATANQIAAGLTGTTGTLNLSSSTLTIATLPIGQGGTGLTTTSQNFAFIGPTSGSGAPTWRLLTAGDIPSLAYAPETSGTSILYGNGSGGFSNVVIGTGLTFSGGTLASTASSGTVTSITPSSGLTNTPGSAGTAITSTGTLYSYNPVNSQTGTTYAVSNTDQSKLVTLSNSSPVAVTLPQAGAGSAFLSGWSTTLSNLGSGLVTITPTTSTINGLASITLTQYAGVEIFSDGTNYETFSGGGGVTSVSAGNLSPLFTTSVATATTTPDITFTLSSVAADSWFGNATGSSSTPSFNTSVIPASIFPALTGDVTNTAGSLSTTVGKINGTSLAGLASGVLYNTTSTGVPSIATANQIAAGLTGTTGTLNLASSTLTIPTLPIGQGGTGLTSTTQNFVFAGPTSGSGAPSWRLLVAADIPALSYAPETSGTSILYGNGSGGFSNVTVGTGLTFSGGTLASTASGGTVTSITPGAGSTNTPGSAGTAITTTGTIYSYYPVNAQTGTTYVVLNTDQDKLVTFSNTSSIAVTLPQAGAASAFLSGWNTRFTNLNTGVVTITPTTSTIDGAASIVLNQHSSIEVFSDGTNYETFRGIGTLTSFSSGSLSPLFTTSVATSTSTPALTFTLSSASADSWFGNATGSSAAPSFNTSAIPAAIFPALTGDVTNTAGSLSTTVGKINGTSLAGLASGILYNTTSTGVPSIATANQVAAGLTGTTGTLNLSSATLTIPTLPIAQGGTGLTTTSQNFAFIGPTSGSGAPSWRLLVAGDIPALSYAPQTSGTSILYGNGSGGFSNVTVGSGLSFSGGTLTSTGSGGTVTSFSAGSLSPLFTTSVATSTSTPALTFTITNAAADSWFGNATGSSAAPSFNTSAIPAAIFPALTGDVTNSAGSLATTVGKINGTSLAGLASGLLYNTTSTGVPSIATANQIAAGLTGTTGTLNLSSATLTIPTLPVGQGGTGATTLTGILQGNGTSAFSVITVGTGLTFSGGTLSATGGGGSSGSLHSYSTNQTIATTVEYAIFTGSSPSTFTIPSSTSTGATAASPFTLNVKNNGSASLIVAIAVASGDNIDGGSSATIPANTQAAIEMVTDGSGNWYIF